MRSLTDAGVASLPPFVRPTDLNDRPFEILSARLNPNGYGNKPEIVYTVRDILHSEGQADAVRYDDEGDPLGPVYSMTLGVTDSRMRHVDWLAQNPRETLGPCQFQFLASRTPGQSPFANIVDYVEFDATPVLGSPRAPVNDEQTRRVAEARPAIPARRRGAAPPVRPDDDEPQDLPF